MLYFVPVIVLLAASSAHKRPVLIFWGIVAAALMLVEGSLLAVFAGIGSATSTGQGGYALLGGLVLLWVVSLSLYFSKVLRRSGQKRE